VVWVHGGELLEHVSGGRWPATPHRVINRSHDRTRVSIPVFVNPPLDSIVPVWRQGGSAVDEAPDEGGEHVHRVLQRHRRPAPFHFGSAEWRRKGLGGWCHACHGPSVRELHGE
jgi:isopenicillin N synthase-like dioxygenase